jgi:hypothetical protein
VYSRDYDQPALVLIKCLGDNLTVTHIPKAIFSSYPALDPLRVDVLIPRHSTLP